MGLYQVIKQRWTSRIRLSEIADEIADRCLDAVWQRVRYQLASLTSAEARGYIRARGIAILEPQLALASARHKIRKQLGPQLYSLSVERVILRVQDRSRENDRFRRAA